MAILLGGIVFAGFARTFYLRPAFTGAELAPLVLIHGTLFTSWMVLLIAQTSLVAAGRTDLHRRVGIAGAVVAGAMVVVGTWTALAEARRKADIAALRFLVVPLVIMVLFAAFVGVAVKRSRKSQSHKRLMVLATIALLPAPVARLPIAFIQHGGWLAIFTVADLPLAVCVGYDVAVRGRPHRALIAGGLLLVTAQALGIALGDTDAWLTFARYLVG
jgi:hypothetical protein